MERFVIKREDQPGRMLSGVGIGCNINAQTMNRINWTSSKSCAIQFEEGEAEATIAFITDVLDWELGEQLYIEHAEV